MRRQQPIAHVLYNHLFPNPTANDPPSFASHLARNLVPEVRIEVALFYGDLNSTEARYPGLNYCHGPHRLRLGRFKHHRRLFEAFDTLGLTYGEIQDFCCWEGTKWARERYEKDEGIQVLDTTGDDIATFVDRRIRKYGDERRRQSITRKTDISVVVEPVSGSGSVAASNVPAESHDEDMRDVDDEAEASHEHSTSDGPLLSSNSMLPTMNGVFESAERVRPGERNMNDLQHRREYAIDQRIMAAYERGQMLSPEIEQYLKEQRERGMLAYNALAHNRDALPASLSTNNASSRPTPVVNHLSA